jgi:hypothetical protein
MMLHILLPFTEAPQHPAPRSPSRPLAPPSLLLIGPRLQDTNPPAGMPAIDAALILAGRECCPVPINLTGFIPASSTITTLEQPGVSETLFVKAAKAGAGRPSAPTRFGLNWSKRVAGPAAVWAALAYRRGIAMGLTGVPSGAMRCPHV